MKNTFTYTILVLCAFCTNLFAKTFTIGPLETYNKVSEVASLIDHGDTIFIKAGTYTNDKQVTISKDNIVILGAEGRPILRAGEIIANDPSNGKGIFVIKGNNVTIENIAFYDAKVVDNNGAGIRQEGCDLKVIRCLFLNNEMGILCGTIPDCKTTIEYCEFAQNGSPAYPGYQHNVYINNIDTLIFRFNISRDATAEGHELKSRAKFNYIAYNCLSNFSSEDSRTIDLPNGGTSIIIGNVIEQGPNSANSNILGYGLEGMSNPGPHALYVVNNTFVNRRNSGSFIHVPNTKLDKFLMVNNAMMGIGQSIIGNQEGLVFDNNVMEANLNAAATHFEAFDNFNYALVQGSTLIDGGQALNEFVGDYSLTPKYEFHSLTKIFDRADDDKIDVGAYEFLKSSSVAEYVTKLNIYPNPSNDYIIIEDFDSENADLIHISSKQHYVLKVYDGKIDIRSLPCGMYILNSGRSVSSFLKI